jgi:hypothetical protein
MRARILSLFLLSVLVLGMGSYFPFFKLQQLSVRRDNFHKIERAIAPTEILTILMTPENRQRILWEEEEKEFVLDGKMYDVLAIDTIKGVERFQCICDVKENDLISRFDELSLEDTGITKLPSKHKTNTLLELITALVYLPGNTVRFSNPEAGIEVFS